MYVTRIDDDPEGLFLKLEGTISGHEMERAATELRTAATSFDPGFTLLTDLTECHGLEPDARKAVADLLSRLDVAGLQTEIRLVGEATPEPVTGAFNDATAGLTYTVERFPSLRDNAPISSAGPTLAD